MNDNKNTIMLNINHAKVSIMAWEACKHFLEDSY